MNQQRVEQVEIELKKMEFEEMYQVPNVNQVTWNLMRRYSVVRNDALNRMDLNLFDPSSDLAEDDVKKTLPPVRCEPFAGYVNFGVWKWDKDNLNTSFLFTVNLWVRKLERCGNDHSYSPFNLRW